MPAMLGEDHGRNGEMGCSSGIRNRLAWAYPVGGQVDDCRKGGINFRTSAALFVAPSAIAAHPSITCTTNKKSSPCGLRQAAAVWGSAALLPCFFELMSGSAATLRREISSLHAAAACLDGSARNDGSRARATAPDPSLSASSSASFPFDWRTPTHAACNRSGRHFSRRRR